jgi:hypothetical protein
MWTRVLHDPPSFKQKNIKSGLEYLCVPVFNLCCIFRLFNVILPTFHPILPTFHPILPTFHPILPTFHPILPTFHPILPTFHPIRPYRYRHRLRSDMKMRSKKNFAKFFGVIVIWRVWIIMSLGAENSEIASCFWIYYGVYIYRGDKIPRLRRWRGVSPS